MSPRESDDVVATAGIDALALFAEARADARTGDEYVLLSRDEEALLRRLDTPEPERDAS